MSWREDLLYNNRYCRRQSHLFTEHFTSFKIYHPCHDIYLGQKNPLPHSYLGNLIKPNSAPWHISSSCLKTMWSPACISEGLKFCECLPLSNKDLATPCTLQMGKWRHRQRHCDPLPWCGRDKDKTCLRSEATLSSLDCATAIHKCVFISYSKYAWQWRH